MTFEEWKRKKHEESGGYSFWAKIPDEYLHPWERKEEVPSLCLDDDDEWD